MLVLVPGSVALTPVVVVLVVVGPPVVEEPPSLPEVVGGPSVDVTPALSLTLPLPLPVPVVPSLAPPETVRPSVTPPAVAPAEAEPRPSLPLHASGSVAARKQPPNDQAKRNFVCIRRSPRLGLHGYHPCGAPAPLLA